MIDRTKIIRALNTTVLLPEVYVESEIDSTNLYAKRLLQEGLETNAVVIAERQISGSGRSNRTWHSPLGGLYMSIVLQNRKVSLISPLYSFVLAISAADVLERMTSLVIDLKWPNDLHISGKKIGGILSELITDNPDRPAIILGIGINLNEDISGFPDELQNVATSILTETGKTVEYELVVSEIINSIDTWLIRDPDLELVIDKYRSKCTSIGKHVSVQLGQTSFTGTVLDVVEQGSLLVRDTSGREVLISAGEVFHLEGG